MPDDSKIEGHMTCPSCRSALKQADVGRCPECGAMLEKSAGRGNLSRFLSIPEMRYQNAYVWLVLLSSLDIMLTYLVLWHWEGSEANPVAAAVIETGPFYWAILLKFGLVVIAIVICEGIGRMSDRQGRKLSIAFVIIGAIPVVYTITLLLSNPLPLPH